MFIGHVFLYKATAHAHVVCSELDNGRVFEEATEHIVEVFLTLFGVCARV